MLTYFARLWGGESSVYWSPESRLLEGCCLSEDGSSEDDSSAMVAVLMRLGNEWPVIE